MVLIKVLRMNRRSAWLFAFARCGLTTGCGTTAPISAPGMPATAWHRGPAGLKRRLCLWADRAVRAGGVERPWRSVSISRRLHGAGMHLILELRDSILATHLCRIHRKIGIAEYLIACRSRSVERDADACGCRYLLSANVQWSTNGCQYSFGQLDGFVRV